MPFEYRGFSFGFILYVFMSYKFYTFQFCHCRFSPKYVKEYIEGAKPVFSVGEYWDTCNYMGSSLDYNQGIVLKYIFSVIKYINTLVLCILHFQYLAYSSLNFLSVQIAIGNEQSIGLMALDSSQLRLTSQQREFSRYQTFCAHYLKWTMIPYRSIQLLNIKFIEFVLHNYIFHHKLLFSCCHYLQEAVKREYWRLCDAQGKPPGVIGWWPSRSATFIDNHDTGSTQVPQISMHLSYFLVATGKDWSVIIDLCKINFDFEF